MTTTTLSGKVAFVTGGAQGIGRFTAIALAERGARLVLTDIDETALREVAAEIGEDRVLPVVADVRDLGAMEDAAAQAISRFGSIDYVLANAGIASYGSILQVDPETFRRVVDINLVGVFNTVRATLPSIIDSKGYVLIVSSLAAFTPAPGLAAYNATKAGVEAFGNALRFEVSYQGVDVGTAHMSWIDTPLVQDAKRDLSAFSKMLRIMPPPLGKTTDVQACVDAFVRALEKRSRRVYVPGWVAAIAHTRMSASGRLVQKIMERHTPTILPQMDEEVRRMGRSTSDRNLRNEARADVTAGSR